MSAAFEKKAKVLKEYERKCVSKYDPPQSKPLVFWKIDDFDYSSAASLICGHVLFSSPYTFIDHILWILHPKSFHSHIDQQHFSKLYLLFARGICTNCIICMLAKISFEDLINMYSVNMREFLVMSPNNGGAIGSLLYLRVFCHPKMHRIISNTCSLNKKMYLTGEIQSECNKRNSIEGYVHDFDFICDIIVGEAARSLPHDADSTRTQNLYAHMMAYLRTLYLSIKYWKKYQVLFFVKHYLLDLQSSWIRLHAILVDNQHIKHLWDINMLLKYSFAFIAQKAKKLRYNEICDTDIWDALKRYLNQNEVWDLKQQRKDEIKGMKSILRCGSYKCCKQQVKVSKPFKVCKQCKMIYYCSRHCQKQSWKADHKVMCLKLSKWYNL